MIVALFSGGKESLYAVYKAILEGVKPDMLIHIIYQFPRPSPHTLNIEVVKEIARSIGFPFITFRTTKGKEKQQTIDFLTKLKVKSIVAGDIYIDEHRAYLEEICRKIGAECYEPLWNSVPEKLLMEMMNLNFKVLIVGLDSRKLSEEWLGQIINEDNVSEFINHSKIRGFDPCGEHGEYHTLVIDSKLHRWPIKIKQKSLLRFNEYLCLQIDLLKNAGTTNHI